MMRYRQRVKLAASAALAGSLGLFGAHWGGAELSVWLVDLRWILFFAALGLLIVGPIYDCRDRLVESEEVFRIGMLAERNMIDRPVKSPPKVDRRGPNDSGASFHGTGPNRIV